VYFIPLRPSNRFYRGSCVFSLSFGISARHRCHSHFRDFRSCLIFSDRRHVFFQLYRAWTRKHFILHFPHFLSLLNTHDSFALRKARPLNQEYALTFSDELGGNKPFEKNKRPKVRPLPWECLGITKDERRAVPSDDIQANKLFALISPQQHLKISKQ